MLQAAVDRGREHVNGTVRLKLYRGGVTVVGRRSEDDSLFDEAVATFEDDAGAYRQDDASGFIRLNALRFRVAARKRGKRG
jgi:argininosuccinate synthase